MSAARGTEGLQPQDLVLTIFGAYVRRPGQRVWSGGMVEILESLDFTTGAARAALARLVNRDLLARTREGRLAFYALTERATALLAEGDRRIFSFGRTAPGVDLWTVLWHAIPEAQRVRRSRFASRLRFLGFGSVQDATWVAARDREQEVRHLLRQLDIEPYVSVLVGHMSPGLPPVALVAEAWRLDDTRDRYEAFLSEYGALRTGRARKRLSDPEAFRTRTVLLHRFRGFPSVDPELPEAVDTLRELRAEVVACFEEVYAALERPATQYFWATVRPDLA
ncbi:MAG TPA: PaaX family transcriptional regulator C-terminal domain-containing protein [Solirubrobacteraceae bacterium]|nr:PaaX family transcriptional regulator C-terminal domain-containing protein [Solirubrobacteraceae bacterium]